MACLEQVPAACFRGGYDRRVLKVPEHSRDANATAVPEALCHSHTQP